jgi:hypothetical protein
VHAYMDSINSTKHILLLNEQHHGQLVHAMSPTTAYNRASMQLCSAMDGLESLSSDQISTPHCPSLLPSSPLPGWQLHPLVALWRWSVMRSHWWSYVAVPLGVGPLSASSVPLVSCRAPSCGRVAACWPGAGAMSLSWSWWMWGAR